MYVVGLLLCLQTHCKTEMALRNSKGCYEDQWGGYEAPKNSFGPVSILPIYHGYDEHRCFHYLCKTQYDFFEHFVSLEITHFITSMLCLNIVLSFRGWNSKAGT